MKKTSRFLLLGLLFGSTFQLAHATDNVWISNSNADWNTAGNWDANGIPDTATERAVFNGTGSQNVITFAANAGGGAGFNGILVTGAQTSNLSINSTTGTPNFRIAGSSGITINAGAGAFSMGTSGGNIQIVPQSVSTYTFQNDSSNLATLGSKITSTTGGGNANFTLVYAGAGNWLVNEVINPSTSTGASNVTKNGTGTTTLAGANTYTGVTTVNAGTLKAGVASVGGTNGAFGRSSVTMANAAGATLDLNGFATDIGSLAGGGALGGNVTLGSGTLTTGRLNTSTAYAGIISGTGGFTKIGTGTQTLSGANTYSGGTSISTGTLSVGSIGTVAGASSNLGAAGGLRLGSTTTTGTLIYTGTGETTDRALTFPGGTGGATLTQSGTGILNFTGAISVPGTAATDERKTLTLQGSTTGSGTISGAITDAVLGTAGQLATSVTKSGTDTWTLSGANTYTGATTINGGTLAFTGSSLPSGTSLTVAGGATLNLADGTARSTSLSGLNLGSGSILNLDWFGSATDTLTTTAAATTSGTVWIQLNTAAPSGSGLTLFHAASGLSSASYLLTNATAFTAALNVTDTDVTIGSYTPTSPLTTAYWTGGLLLGAENILAVSDGTVSNWSTTSSTYTATGLTPGATTDIVFSIDSGASQEGNLVLGANMVANSLTFVDTAPLGITADGHSLTLMSTGTGAASAINAVQNATINPPIVLGASQSWTVASGITLAVTGNVSGAAGLTKSDSGTLTLSSANTYTGGTTIAGGTLAISNIGALGSGNIAFGNNSTLQVSTTGNLPSANTLSVGSGNSALINFGGSGALSLGTGAITLNGTLRVTRTTTGTGVVNFTGTLGGSGTLEVGNTQSGVTPIATSGSQGRFNITNTNAYDAFTGNIHILNGGNLTLFNGTLLSANNNNVTIDSGGYISILGGTTTFVNTLSGGGTVTRNSGVASTATLSVASGTFSGVISQSQLGGVGPVALIKTGPGTLTLSGPSVAGVPTANSDFAGNITVDGKLIGAAVRTGANTVFGAASNARTITVNSGATLEFQAPNTFGNHNATSVPSLVVTSGTVTNADPALSNAVNNALNNITLNDGTLTSTTGSAATLDAPRDTETYGSWNINGTVTSTGTSTISTTATGNGQVMLGSAGSDTTFAVNSGTLTVSAPLMSGDNAFISGLVKTGTGTLTLSGVNTYTGNTTVNAGTLVVNGSSIKDTNRLTINGGTVTPTGTETVGTLFFGTDQQIAGTWGATGSGAAHIDDVHFSGTGVVNVTTGPAHNFSTWIAGFSFAPGADQTPTGDPDHDGISNAIEYALGLDPTQPNGATGTLTGGVLTFTKGSEAISNGDVTYIIEESDDLGITDAWAAVVTQTPPNASPTISYTLPTGKQKEFVRLSVTLP